MDIKKSYSLKANKKQCFDEKTLQEFAALDSSIEKFNYIGEYENIRDCIVNELVGKLFKRENIVDARLVDEVMSSFSDETGGHVAVIQKYRYNENKIDLILVADNCYVRYNKTDIILDSELTAIWRDVLSILYDDYIPNLNK